MSSILMEHRFYWYRNEKIILDRNDKEANQGGFIEGEKEGKKIKRQAELMSE